MPYEVRQVVIESSQLAAVRVLVRRILNVNVADPERLLMDDIAGKAKRA